MTRAGASLIRLGLTESWAEDTLTQLGWWAGTSPAEGAEQIMWALARSPDPGLALRGAERLVAALTDRADRRAFDAALRAERGSAGTAVRLAGELDRARRPPRRAPRPLAPALRRRRATGCGVARDRSGAWHCSRRSARNRTPRPRVRRAAATASLTGSAAITALRAAYRDELLVLAAADLAAAPSRSCPCWTWRTSRAAVGPRGRGAAGGVGRRVAESADDQGGDPGRLAVIAMGKCGGRELNYVSDVDVIFVAEPADAADRPARGPGDADPGRVLLRGGRQPAPRGPPGRAGAHARRPRRLLPAVGQDVGVPGAAQGPPDRGRPGAGQGLRRGRRADGVERVADGRTSSVDVQAMRRRVEENVRPDHRTREIKLGPGGLRDVEFAVQLLQLVHGRTDEALRSGSTLDALRALSDGGYVGRDDGANLAASYRFLRLLEHRLQLQRLRRTHLLPAANDTDALRWLARVGEAAARRAQRRRRRAHGGVDAATPAGCGGCTRSCSTARCSPRCRGCRSTPRGCRRRRPPRGSARWVGRRRRARCGTCAR